MVSLFIRFVWNEARRDRRVWIVRRELGRSPRRAGLLGLALHAARRYPPDKYSRYERRGILRTGVLLRLVEAIKTSGHGQVNYDWLFDFKPGPMFYPSEPQKRRRLG